MSDDPTIPPNPSLKNETDHSRSGTTNHGTFRLEGARPNDHLIALIPFNDLDRLPRLMSLVSTALERRGSGAISWDSVGYIISVHPDQSIGLCDIRLAYIQRSGSRVFAVFIERANLSQAEPWLILLHQALSELNNPAPKVIWSAIVGPDPYSEIGPHVTTLESTINLGPFEILAGNSPYLEKLPCLSPSQIGCTEHFVSWPVQVRGETELVDKFHLSDQVLVDLAILVSILSLAFERPWIVRHQPYPFSGSMDPLLRASIDDQDLHEISSVPIQLPAWISTAWDLCKSEPTIKDALLVYQEAIRMMSWHPSWALAAFMSALQTIGSQITGRPTKQIRAALDTCLSPDQVTEIMRLYSLRGDTVHAGALFGHEPFAGVAFRASSLNPLRLDPVTEFHLRTLASLQRAVRSILIHQFEKMRNIQHASE